MSTFKVREAVELARRLLKVFQLHARRTNCQHFAGFDPARVAVERPAEYIGNDSAPFLQMRRNINGVLPRTVQGRDGKVLEKSIVPAVAVDDQNLFESIAMNLIA